MQECGTDVNVLTDSQTIEALELLSQLKNIKKPSYHPIHKSNNENQGENEDDKQKTMTKQIETLSVKTINAFMIKFHLLIFYITHLLLSAPA